jgi:preprotein translocase subunit SecE
MGVSKQNQEAAAPTTFGLMKYVHVMFFAGTVVVGWVLVKLIEDIWASMHFKFGWVPTPSDWGAIGGGAVVALALGLYLWRHPKVNRLAVEIVTELSKVTWPTRKELSVSTVVVIVVSVIAAIILGLFDLFWSWATDFIY